MADQSGNISGSKLMLVLLFLVSLVAVVAIIVAAVSLTNSDSDTPSINVNSAPAAGGVGGSGASGSMAIYGGGFSGRIFKIAVGHDYAAHEYLDEKGYIQGFTKDLINGVCEAGGMDCRIIWDEYMNCWNSQAGKHGQGGEGLFNGWYDACSGWAGSPARLQVFDLSLPFMKFPLVYFYIKDGSSFDTGDITGKTIGFMDGWIPDEKCLARQDQIKGNVLPADRIVHYAVREAAVAALKAGQIDALYGEYEEFDGLKKVGAGYSCTIQGFSMMTAKDNDFISYWNYGFQKFMDSGKFRQLCKDSIDNHGRMGVLNECVSSP